MVRSAHPTGWADSLCRWELHLKAANRTDQTIETRTEHLRRLARAHPAGPDAFTTTAWEAWSGSHQWSTESRRSFTASVRSFFTWYNQTDPTASIGPIRPAEPAPRPIPDELLHQALAAAHGRTRLVLRLAAEAGLRRAEIAQLRGTDARIGQPCTITVTGKGRKVRTVPISRSLARQVARAGDRWLFPGPHGHISPRHVGVIARRALPTGWTLHTLRHWYATTTYRGSRNLMAVQRLLGHSSPATTQRYVAIDLDELADAASHAQLM